MDIQSEYELYVVVKHRAWVQQCIIMKRLKMCHLSLDDLFDR